MTEGARARRRVVILASTYPRWEGDHEPSFVHALARRLTDRFDVVAVVPHAAGSLRHEMLNGVTVVRYRYAPEWLETLVNNGGIVTNLRRRPWKWALVPGFVLMQWIVARRYIRLNTVVHAHWLLPQGVIARCLGAPYAITCHGADVFALRGKIAVAAKRFAVAAAGGVTVVSHAMLAETAQLGGPATRAIVRPMGADLVHTFTVDPQVLRDDNHLLFVGRLVEKKGVDVLLNAVALLSESLPDLHLSIVGHGPLESELRKLAITLGISTRVSFVGPLSQSCIVDWYRRASLFIAPFRQAASGDVEGLGLVMIEALGCGCPVVASDVPATRDVLSGLPGVASVEPDNAGSLASAIGEMLGRSPAIWLEAAEAAPSIRDLFDWQVVAAAYADLLDQLKEGVA